MADDQLRAELRKLGFNPGPITEQTRPIYLRKLEALRGKAVNQNPGSAASASKVSPGRGTFGASHGKPQKPTSSNGAAPASSYVAKWSGSVADRREENDEQTVSAMVVDDNHLCAAASAQTEILELRAELVRCQHRCATAEQQLLQLQQERSVTAAEGFGEELADDLLRTLDEPMLVSDVCFVTLGGESLLACRSLLAMRCPEMVAELWRPNEFTLTAQTLTGNTCDIDVRRDHSVRAVKELLAAKQGTPVAEQRLVYQSLELEEDKRLADYGIDGASVVHLVIRQARAESGEDSDQVRSSGAGAVQPVSHPTAPLACVIDMPDIPKAALKAFMVYLYSGRMDLSTQTVCEIYVLSRRFKVQALRQKALIFIKQSLNLTCVWGLLDLAHKQCADELKLVCLQFIASQNALQHLPEKLPNICEKLLLYWQLHCPQ